MTKPKSPMYSDLVQPYSDEELESDEAKERAQQIMKALERLGIPYEQIERVYRSFLPEKYSPEKAAYPNYDQYISMPGQHNMEKWLATVKQLYIMEKNGIDRVTAIRRATNGWKTMETFDFLNWLRFYQEGAHMKYKYAQLWYENGQPGYFLNIKPDEAPAAAPHTDGNALMELQHSVEELEERKKTIEKQRQKIIGRLDSAEKLLRSPEGQMFAGKEMEALMEAIFSLKKKVQLVNKLSSSIRLYEDMIVREGNVMRRHGFFKAAEVLYSLAQSPGQAAEGAKGAPSGGNTPPPPAPPPEPTTPQGAPGGLPSAGPGMPAGNPSTVSPPSPPNENRPSPSATTNKGMGDFLKAMETSGLTVSKDDKSKNDDNLEVEDTLEVEDDTLMVSEAQEVPMTTNPAPARGKPVAPPAPEAPAPDAPPGPDAPATEEPLEVTEDDIPKGDGGAQSAQQAAQFDAKVDTLFANLTVADVVAKLEDLAKIFKVREVPRQLAIVDMMLDSLGLASYFPSLSEAQNKALESNNYISTRVEDILSKLRGAISTKDIDLKGGPQADNPEVAGIKGKLEQDAAKEKQRKEMRKQQENAELEGGPGAAKETPEVEMGADLGAPPAPPPAAPPAAPRPPAA